MAESSEGFRFAPKFPKEISHERRLKECGEETKAFLKILDSLQHGDKLGPAYLQLPPSFNINNFDTLKQYLQSLPSDFEYALEPRHISWFDRGEGEEKLDELLSSIGMDKVIFDSRPLFSREAQDADEERAHSRKPQMPVRKTAKGKRPFLRLVCGNDMEQNLPWIKEWAPIINKWILENKQPYIFAHAANKTLAPFVGKALHEQLRKLNPLLPEFPKLASDGVPRVEKEEQLDLF